MAFHAFSEKSVGISMFFIVRIDLVINVAALNVIINDYNHASNVSSNSNQANAAGPSTASALVAVDNNTFILPL